MLYGNVISLPRNLLFAILIVSLNIADGKSNENHAGGACIAEKAQKITKLENRLKEVRGALMDTNVRLSEISQRNAARNQLTDLVDKSQEGLSSIATSAKSKQQNKRRRTLLSDNSHACQERVRLVDGPWPSEGRLEVFVNSQWTAVSSSNFQQKEASIVCGAMGINGYDARVVPTTVFGKGSENMLIEENCNNAVGVLCEGFNTTSVRLVGGSFPGEGRVEVYVAGQWSSVCQTDWDTNEAKVVCRMLGYDGTFGAAVGIGEFGSGTGPAWLYSFNCQGNEDNIMYCSGNTDIGTARCDHSNDAGVICDGIFRYPVRLENGIGPWEGRVEIFAFGRWGTVGVESWDSPDARVVCNMLGYDGNAVAVTSGGVFGIGNGPVWLDGLRCNGNEHHLLLCPTSYAMGVRSFNHNNDAAVRCVGSDEYQRQFPVRLMHGANESYSAGRVEIFVNGTWGTICDHYWDNNDAAVVCRMMGLNGAGATADDMRKGNYDRGEGPIHMSNVGCSGTEKHVVECSFTGFGNTGCSHDSDAGVTCPAPHVRLMNGNVVSHGSGRVEIEVNGTWGTICDDSWDVLDARVVCGMLGFNKTDVTAVGGARFGQGSGPITMNEVSCTGNEAHITLCAFAGYYVHNCAHSEDAGVICQ